MNLADEVTAGPPRLATPHNKSRIDVWLARQADDDRAAALAVLNDPDWSTTDAHALFSRHGLDISAVQFGAYRRSRYGTR